MDVNKMALAFRTLLAALALYSTVCFVVNTSPVAPDYKSEDLSVVINPNRIKRQIVVVGGCPKGKSFYYMKCRSPEEIRRLTAGDYEEIFPTETTPTSATETEQAEVDKVTNTRTSTTSTTPALFESTDQETTEDSLSTNAEVIQTTTPILTTTTRIPDEVTKLKRMTYLTYTLGFIFSFAFMLFCLFMLQYTNCHSRRDEETPLPLLECSKSNICADNAAVPLKNGEC